MLRSGEDEDSALPDGGEGTAVETQCVVSKVVPAWSHPANDWWWTPPPAEWMQFPTYSYRIPQPRCM